MKFVSDIGQKILSMYILWTGIVRDKWDERHLSQTTIKG